MANSFLAFILGLATALVAYFAWDRIHREVTA